jgi:hypothetical protein
MANRQKRSISERLNSAQVAITNTLKNPEILGLVAKYGYTEEKLNEGRSLYDRAVEAATKGLWQRGFNTRKRKK